ncbi:hypothetical protein A2130_01310 [Candidatus Woesebacteria bacterium GWC2_33_12]|uniref:DUF2087 domain-containing protein n=1 Tax=Candidatus Woesebacteria bacterium GW2011_GWB1_33_22 TaxID=1618566 RepID=A0A0F9ZZ41_9BACT|nr:MAG: hypothetical protein UR29_C0012G0007 [Candidatus Woesebacteria bacterium GW2011_GWC2_33_12]KKP41762.1 MAG: hypothetical protein UR33_C0010G0007 [Candidatus Woesebacteria bacterium GW2011_GWA2_33_20]KKP44216.1 MAG: hypothetical protein UR35_C0010G0008 [Candidatus Woesebacteria bacterium GW2011_GWB1_33_22]KKP45922.1 MAG: hypothetical protein UR37_C0013G0008 [Microgenomates group bacterium GW2011_GWC1_33_28]KKP49807.1 MAG: hypothetical protein UR41_C0012G0008 [Candidatus Woesebacteria bact
MSKTPKIEYYLKDGKIETFPSKRKKIIIVLEYLITKFEMNKKYAEKEINEILNNNHLFDNPLLLRRELIDNKYLSRTSDGKAYWRI